MERVVQGCANELTSDVGQVAFLRPEIGDVKLLFATASVVIRFSVVFWSFILRLLHR